MVKDLIHKEIAIKNLEKCICFNVCLNQNILYITSNFDVCNIYGVFMGYMVQMYMSNVFSGL